MSLMKCIVGLGNPGEKYAKNRHNVGFMVLDKLGSEWEFSKKFNAEIIQTKAYILVKPQTYMNDSGVAVAKIVQFYKIDLSDLYIVHDDLDIALGNYKIQHSKGPRIHYGVNSVEEKLGTEDFWRVRVGVENRTIRGNTGIRGEVYSLQDFESEEVKIIEGVIGQIVDELQRMVSL